MADCNSTLTLNGETIANIRAALHLGLAAYGEIERLSAVQWSRTTRGKSTPRALRVIYPDRAADTVSRFAEALRMLG